MSPTTAYYMDTFSSLSEPSRKTLHDASGAEWAVYREANHKLTDEYELLPTEIVNFKSSDGTLLYARLIKPANFHAGEKYPAVVMVYGGPGAQTVHNAWSGANWDQVLAARGFVIWQVDNRGSSGRGHAFETPIYHRMGKMELADQLEGIQYLIAQGFVDPKRVGIYGWSYGGYMTLYSLLNAPRCVSRRNRRRAGHQLAQLRHHLYRALSGASVRQPGRLQASSAVEYAAKLQAKLLMVHNIEDDNVLFQNTMQMADAFEHAGKLFDMVVYPQKSHGVGGPVRRQLLEKTHRFLRKESEVEEILSRCCARLVLDTASTAGPTAT